MKKKELQKLIYKSFDAPLTTEEKELLESELKASAELMEEYQSLFSLRGAVRNSARDTFEPFFEERLLSNLERSMKNEKAYDYISTPLFNSFGKIAAAAIIILIILISYNLNNGNNYSINNLLGKSETNLASVYDPLQNTLGSRK
jgi:hypothetical protein